MQDIKDVEGKEVDLLFIEATIRHAKLAARSENLKNVNTVLPDAMVRAEKGSIYINCVVKLPF